jgi:hypothetical protein
MRINEIENPRPYITKHIEPLDNAKKRMRELSIVEAYPHLMKWIYTGLFSANPQTMDAYANVFYAIRSVLPDQVIATYSNLPTVYRGLMLKNESQLDKISNGGLDIKSQISAWTPRKQLAIDYARSDDAGVVLKHNPVESEVVLALNGPTIKYLGINSMLVANPNETILSLPILKITPEMVEKVIR